MNDSIPSLVNLNEVAKALNVSPHTVRSWVKQRKLHPVRICRRLLFDPAELKRFVSSGQRNPIAEVMQ